YARRPVEPEKVSTEPRSRRQTPRRGYARARVDAHLRSDREPDDTHRSTSRARLRLSGTGGRRAREARATRAQAECARDPLRRRRLGRLRLLRRRRSGRRADAEHRQARATWPVAHLMLFRAVVLAVARHAPHGSPAAASRAPAPAD